MSEPGHTLRLGSWWNAVRLHEEGSHERQAHHTVEVLERGDDEGVRELCREDGLEHRPALGGVRLDDLHGHRRAKPRPAGATRVNALGQQESTEWLGNPSNHLLYIPTCSSLASCQRTLGTWPLSASLTRSKHCQTCPCRASDPSPGPPSVLARRGRLTCCCRACCCRSWRWKSQCCLYGQQIISIAGEDMNTACARLHPQRVRTSGHVNCHEVEIARIVVVPLDWQEGRDADGHHVVVQATPRCRPKSEVGRFSTTGKAADHSSP
jgi:hypothetical protein